jgi:hypothetical protein
MNFSNMRISLKKEDLLDIIRIQFYFFTIGRIQIKNNEYLLFALNDNSSILKRNNSDNSKFHNESGKVG